MKKTLVISSLVLSVAILMLYLTACIMMWSNGNATEHCLSNVSFYESYFHVVGIVTMVNFVCSLLASYEMNYKVCSLLSWIFTGIVMGLSWNIYCTISPIKIPVGIIYSGLGVSALAVICAVRCLKKISSST